MGRYRKIKRDYSRSFFTNRKNYARLYFVVFMMLLILGIPMFAYWQYDTLQMTALEAFGYAPTPTPYAAERAYAGQEALLRGDFDAASQQFEAAVTQQPQNPDYLYEYGMILIEMDRNDEAYDIGLMLTEMIPNDPRGYALAANAIAYSNPTEAIQLALRGIELGGQFAPLHSALAIAYTLVFRYQEALRQGDLAVRLAPMDANARRAFAFPLIYTGDNAEAIRQLEQAIAINPNLTGAYFELAALYRTQSINRPEQAVAIYNAVLEIEPNNERAFLRLCETYAAVGLFQEAEPFCDSALLIDPEYDSAWRMRGQLRYSRRNYEGAIEAFEQCLSLSSDGEPGFNEVEIECLYIRGLAHYFLAECDLAWEWLNAALNHPEAAGSVLESITTGMYNVTVRCPGYAGRQLPTAMPPTPIPPTPIGGY